jgi:hypothetical protein
MLHFSIDWSNLSNVRGESRFSLSASVSLEFCTMGYERISFPRKFSMQFLESKASLLGLQYIPSKYDTMSSTFSSGALYRVPSSQHIHERLVFLLLEHAKLQK